MIIYVVQKSNLYVKVYCSIHNYKMEVTKIIILFNNKRELEIMYILWHKLQLIIKYKYLATKAETESGRRYFVI